MTAKQVLEAIGSGAVPEPGLLRQLARRAANSRELTTELFRDLVEPLSDSFEPAAADAYVDLFSEVISELAPEFDARALRKRYASLGQSAADLTDVRSVFVLSRVTIGADIAVSSVLLDAAKARFPEATIYFVGGRKNAELWSADPRIQFLEAPYDRTGTLQGRIDAHRALIDLLKHPGGLVIDPDSRFTQLGLIPVCPDSRYLLFRSRSIGVDSNASIASLAAEWAKQTLGLQGQPYLAIPKSSSEPRVTVSFGVGENPAKRVSEAFEIFTLQELVRRGYKVLVDTGAGGEEEARVQLAVDQTSGWPGQVQMFRGTFANFASHIAASPLYIGYDSAGQHAAAALGTPGITVFAGYPNERFLDRWRPTGRATTEVLLPGNDLFDRLASAIHAARHSTPHSTLP